MIIDVETGGIFCGEDGKKPANILRVDAVKIEDGKLGEACSSLVATDDIIPKFVSNFVGIANEMLKDAPTLKAVLTDFKEFIKGYTVYARNSEFINKFLTYYGEKNDIQIDLAKEKDYNEISKFLRYGNGIKEYLQNSTDSEPLALAKMLIRNNFNE